MTVHGLAGVSAYRLTAFSSKSKPRPGAFGSDEMPTLVLQLGIDQPAEIEHLIVDEEFNIARVRRRRDQVRVQIVKPVRAHGDPVTRRGRGNAPPFRDAAADQGVGLKNFGTSLVEKFLVIPAASIQFLPSPPS